MRLCNYKVIHMYKLLIEQKRTLFASRCRKLMNDKIVDSAGTKKKTLKKQNKYSETVLLPRTQFPAQLNDKKRVEKDEYLTKVAISELAYYFC